MHAPGLDCMPSRSATWSVQPLHTRVGGHLGLLECMAHPEITVQCVGAACGEDQKGVLGKLVLPELIKC